MTTVPTTACSHPPLPHAQSRTRLLTTFAEDTQASTKTSFGQTTCTVSNWQAQRIIPQRNIKTPTYMKSEDGQRCERPAARVCLRGCDAAPANQCRTNALSTCELSNYVLIGIGQHSLHMSQRITATATHFVILRLSRMTWRCTTGCLSGDSDTNV